MTDWDFLMHYPEDSDWADADEVLDRICSKTYIGLASWYVYRAKAKVSVFRSHMNASLRTLDTKEHIDAGTLAEMDRLMYAESLRFDVEGLDDDRKFEYSFGGETLIDVSKGWEHEWVTCRWAKVKDRTAGNGLVMIDFEQALLGLDNSNSASLDESIAGDVNNARHACNKMVRQMTVKDGPTIVKTLTLKKALNL